MNRPIPAGRPGRTFLLHAATWLLAGPWLLFPQWRPGLAAVALLALLWWRLAARRRQGRFLQPAPWDGLVAFHLALAGIAVLLSPAPELGLPKLTVTLWGVFAYLLAQEWLANGGKMPAFITLLALAGAGIALLSLFTLQFPQRQIIDLRFLTSRLPHLSGAFFLNNNELAGTLVILLPFALATWWPRPDRRFRWPGAAAIGLITSSLLLSQSRGGALALAAALLGWKLWGRRPLRRLLPLLAGILLLSLLALFFAGNTPAGRAALDAIDALSKSGLSHASWLARLEIWQNGWHMWRDYPVLGAGLYAFEPVSRANYVYRIIGPTFPLTHAHNLFLQEGASLGLPGAAAVAILWASVLTLLWPDNANPAFPRRQASLFAASAIAYLLFSLFDVLTFGQKPGVVLWLLLAGAATLMRPGEAPQAAVRWLRWGQWVPAGLLLALLPALPANLARLQLDRLRLHPPPVVASLPAEPFAGDPRRLGLLAALAGDQDAALSAWRDDPEAALFLQTQGQLAAQAERYQEALTWYNLSLSIDPQGAEAYFWRGLARERNGEAALAAADYETAARLLPGSALPPSRQALILHNWGRIALQSGDLPGARAAFEAAIRLEPDNPWHYQRLGDTLAAMGEREAAAQANRAAASRR